MHLVLIMLSRTQTVITITMHGIHQPARISSNCHRGSIRDLNLLTRFLMTNTCTPNTASTSHLHLMLATTHSAHQETLSFQASLSIKMSQYIAGQVVGAESYVRLQHWATAQEVRYESRLSGILSVAQPFHVPPQNAARLLSAPRILRQQSEGPYHGPLWQAPIGLAVLPSLFDPAV